MSTGPMECGSCGRDHPSAEPCARKNEREPGRRAKKLPTKRHEIILDRDDPEHERRLSDWGGLNVLTLELRQGVKRVYVHVCVRISGDSRAGSQRGFHVSLRAMRKNTDVVKSVHAVPWLPDSRDGDDV